MKNKEILMRRVGKTLVPGWEVDEEHLVDYPTNQDLFVTIRTHRNPRQHRLAWSIASLISEHHDAMDRLKDICLKLGLNFLMDIEPRYDTRDAMDRLLLAIRHVQQVTDRWGNTYDLPKSISFASLPQHEFKRVLDRLIWAAYTVLGCTKDELMAELHRRSGL